MRQRSGEGLHLAGLLPDVLRHLLREEAGKADPDGVGKGPDQDRAGTASG